MSIQVMDYVNALNDFNAAIDIIPSVFHPENERIYKPVCHILGICRIDIHFEEPMKPPSDEIIFGVNQLPTEAAVSQKEIARNGSVAVYTAYKDKNFPDWDENDKKIVHGFIKNVFIVNGRTRVMCMVDRLMYFDAEMDLGNLSAFFRKVSIIIKNGNITNYGACYFNLKRFSVINRSYGRDNGTKVMKRFVKSLAGKLKDAGVYRIGGDNFITLFEKDELPIVQDHLEGTKITVEVFGSPEVNITTNAGYYMCTDEVRAPTDVMDKVSTAIIIAKSNHKINSFFYNDEARKRMEHQKLIEAQFTNAIEKCEFEAFYQPKVDIASGRIIGAEALCRWIKNGMIVPPIEFIPILEQSNAICTLDFYMLDRTCKDIRGWLDEGRNPVKVSVNLSRMHLGDELLLDKIINIIDRNNVPHEYIEIELTETTTDVDFGELRSIVNGLHNNGISASVDDFGVGYSSLTLIKELPWDVLKIDKSFLPDGSENDKQKSIMLRHVVSMAQGLGLECIIEGVETTDQIELLKDIHCFTAQGFYFDKPLPKKDFEKKLELQYSVDKSKN